MVFFCLQKVRSACKLRLHPDSSQKVLPMKIICLGNYPPRQCGIATFTENLIKAILAAAGLHSIETDIEVIAMNDQDNTYDYPGIVTQTIADQNLQAYVDMAEKINQSGADVLLVQHEYGIFGGNSGLFLLSLLRKVKIPVVCTFHTVLEKPGFHQLEVLTRMAEYASKVVIMNKIAIDFLVRIYHVPLEKIVLIEHGTPDFEALSSQLEPAPDLWSGRKVMMTFGLIGRSKGIETVIRALPAITEKHPDLLYVILGKTHPNIVRYSGEEYRHYLQQLVSDLGMGQHVVFINEYVSEITLMSLLRSADVYVTPYLNKAQITSGTLSYAVSSGCAVFSTPYWHAESLLEDERGWLFGFGNHQELASLVSEAFSNPTMMQSRRQKAATYGKTIAWPKIGYSYLQLFENLRIGDSLRGSRKPMYPQFDVTHLKRLTDDTGLLQHAHGILPAYRHGYSLDDNSRAMLVVITAYKHDPQPVYLDLLIRYFAFLRLMIQKNGQVKNYLTFDRQQLNDDCSDDAYGRAVWALGYLIRYAPNDALFQTAMESFHKMIPAMNRISYARGYANCMFGLFHYTRRFPDQEQFLSLISEVAEMLCHRFEQHSRENWEWFEDALTYDNGLIPAALYVAYSVTSRPKYLAIAEKSRLFLETKCFRNDWLSLIGNKRWLRFDSEYELFAQQPIDAMAMMMLYKSAHLATGEPSHIQQILRCFDWFLGNNDLNISVFDAETKGCNDGIEPGSINRNQGAESTIAWLLAQLIANPYLS